jgi:hypothetical protein
MSKIATKQASTATMNYDTAMAAFVRAKKERDEGKVKAATMLKELQSVRNQIAGAVRSEDFAKASELKTRRDELEAAVSREAIAKLAKAVSDASDALTAIYFKENPGHLTAGSLTVTRVTVVNPETNNSADAIYTDAGDTVDLSLDGRSFSSEGYHLSTWAIDAGFLVHVNSVEVRV